MARLTTEQKADIKCRVEEASEGERGTVRKALAEEMGMSYNCILVNSQGGGSKPQSAGKKKAGAKKTKKDSVPAASGAGNVFTTAVCGIVDGKFAAFREELPALIETALAKLIKG